MKKLRIIANWKSHKTIAEARDWLTEFKNQGSLPAVEIVLCAPFTTLSPCKTLIGDLTLPVELGAQNLSPYPDGAYTGEISASMLTELVKYVIIGHSERRTLFHETDEELFKKVAQAKVGSILPIYCIQDEQTVIPDEVTIVAYEPVFAIGSGQTDTPDHANLIGKTIKSQRKDCIFIYGGSVKPDNIATLVHQEFIDGVLVGGASLDPKTFYDLIQNATASP